MHKVYLSVIGFLLLVLVFIWTLSPGVPSPGVYDQGTGQEQASEPLSVTFEAYFKGVTPKKGLFEGREGAVLNLEEVPDEERKSYAAGLLLEARKSLNVEKEIGIPALNHMDSFFTPTDSQLKALHEDDGSQLETRILNSSLQLKQAGDLISQQLLSERLEHLSEEYMSIEPYEQESLFAFSLAFNEYRRVVEQLITITDSSITD